MIRGQKRKKKSPEICGRFFLFIKRILTTYNSCILEKKDLFFILKIQRILKMNRIKNNYLEIHSMWNIFLFMKRIQEDAIAIGQDFLL